MKDLGNGLGMPTFSPTTVTAAADIRCQGLGFSLLLPSRLPTPSCRQHHPVARLQRLANTRLGDGFGSASFTLITITAAANTPGTCEWVKGERLSGVAVGMGFAVVMRVAGRIRALDRPP